MRIERSEHRRPIARGEDQIPRLGELLRHQHAKFLVILDEEYGLLRRTRRGRVGLPLRPRWDAYPMCHLLRHFACKISRFSLLAMSIARRAKALNFEVCRSAVMRE